MADELHGLLVGHLDIAYGVKFDYSGNNEAFLQKVITPLYHVIEKVCFLDYVLRI